MQVHPAPSSVLLDRLHLIFDWYGRMVDARTGRLLYSYEPDSDTVVADGSLIRDVASIWDVEVLGDFLGRDELRPLTLRSLEHFAQFVVERDGYAILGAREPASIAHNAFMILALARSRVPDRVTRLVPLSDGIVRQQRRSDGSFKIFFGPEEDAGEDLYPAEAMLALLEAHGVTGDTRYLESATRGYAHYKSAYHDRGRVEPGALVFFANWQAQAGRTLFDASPNPSHKELVRAFVLELHDRIIADGFYDAVERSPHAQSCVEVACALEGLNDALAIAASTRDDLRAARYHACVRTALEFLCAAQRTSACTERERGGFGASLLNRAQRIDVTGHVASGFMKAMDNGILGPHE